MNVSNWNEEFWTCNSCKFSIIYLWTEVLWFIYLVHWTLACNKCVYYYYYYSLTLAYFNMLARVVLRTNRLSSAGPLLNELHWLPVASRIQFKIATLTHKILSTGTPSYLSSLLSHYKPTRQLRSSSSNLLVQPPSKTKFGSLAFHTAAPLIWNVRSSPSFQTFKKMLKTHYFCSPPT